MSSSKKDAGIAPPVGFDPPPGTLSELKLGTGLGEGRLAGAGFGL